MRMRRLIAGAARCSSSLLKARLTWPGPAVSKQSVERLPLVMDEKAKLATANTQVMVLGVGRLICPRKEMFWSHSVKDCTAPPTCSSLK